VTFPFHLNKMERSVSFRFIRNGNDQRFLSPEMEMTNISFHQKWKRWTFHFIRNGNGERFFLSFQWNIESELSQA